jgi:hypothetical protein
VVSRALGACLALLALAPVAVAPAQPLPGGRGLVATTSLTPTTHLFGDPVVARLDVVLDPAQFDPDRLDIRLRFDPYEPVGAVTRTQREIGGLVHLRYEARLRCLHLGCIAPRFETALGGQEEGRAERHAIRLPPVELVYREDGGSPRVLLAKLFPVVEVVSRVNTARLQGLDPDARPGSEGSFVASLEPPERTYRIRPTLLAGVLVGVAILLALFPATLAGRALRARWRSIHREGPLSPVDRALVLVEWSARRDDAEDRRKALEALAVVLEDEGERPLAERARELAWSALSPAGEQAVAAGAEARKTLTGAGDGRPS